MIWEGDPGVDVEGGLGSDFADCVSEELDVGGEEGALAVLSVDGEEVGAAGDGVASVICHFGIVFVFGSWASVLGG